MPPDSRAFGAPLVIQGCFLTPPRLSVVQLQAQSAPPVAARARHVELAVQRGAIQPRMVPSGSTPRVGPPPPAAPAALQRQATQQAGGRLAWQVSPSQATLAAATGAPLAPPVRQSMETLFGADFSAVRVHVGPQAPALGAVAFTHGSQLYFAPGHFAPQTPRGLQLLAHELTHVVQQRQGRVSNPFGAGVAVVQDPCLEAEAQRMSVRAASIPVPGAAASAQPRAVQRFPAPGFRAAPPPPFHSRVIQRVRLEPSDNFTEEIKTYKGNQGHSKYFNQIVKPWLTQVKNLVPEAKVTAQQQFKSRPGSWNDVQVIITTVNNLIPVVVVDNVVENVEVDTLGLPVSARAKIGGTKYPTINDYRVARRAKQETRKHIEITEEIQDSLLGKTSGAKDVDALISINGGGFILAPPSNRFGTSFAVPFVEHDHEDEIVTSSGDGEVAVLARALAAFAGDFETESDAKRRHRLALVGKYGACDGCKDRLRRFKVLWKELAAGAEVDASLTITYFYREVSQVVERDQSLYGWKEEQEGSFQHKVKSKGMRTTKFYFRSYGAKHKTETD